MTKKIILIAHRGTKLEYDENTIISFSKALENGADFIEFDLHRTKDHKLVINHDNTLQRTYNGNGIISNMTYAEICKFRTRKDGQKMPLFTEVISAFKNKTKFIIELKGDDVVEPAAKIIEKYNIISNCVISSKNLWKLKRIKSFLPNCRICYNITKGKEFTLKEFLKNNSLKIQSMKFDMISLRSILVSKHFVSVCHSNNIIALAWDFINLKNSILKIRELLKLDIDGILFDSLTNLKIIRNELIK